ncbi:hypothetical protein AOLI_G00207790 [Acnodon oligacanthus]
MLFVRHQAWHIAHVALQHFTLCVCALLTELSSEAVRMSRDQLDSVASHMESLLSVAVQLQAQCREQSVHLAALTAQLREEAQNLRQQTSLAEQDMAEIHKTLEELMDTKMAFEAKERQARKLSRQL